MNEISLFRLYVLRAMYLFIVVGLGVYLWPDVLDPNKHWELMQGEASCMLAAFSLLCVVGLRYPLQMLLGPTIFAISLVGLVYLAIPWHYVYAHYIKAGAERWR
jgi:hypothetical protein